MGKPQAKPEGDRKPGCWKGRNWRRAFGKKILFSVTSGKTAKPIVMIINGVHYRRRPLWGNFSTLAIRMAYAEAQDPEGPPEFRRHLLVG